MGSPANTLWLAPDSCDPHLAQAFAADGDMPTLARLLDEAAVVPTQGPVGYSPALHSRRTPTATDTNS